MPGGTPVAGIHSVRAALRQGAAGVAEVWLEARRRDRRLAELAELARKAGVALRQVGREELERAAGGVNHQGALAWLEAPAAAAAQDLDAILEGLEGPPFLLILDGVQDPHNLGACLRTADAAGVHAVVAPKDNAAGLTPTVLKVASGAAGSVPLVQVTNLARAMGGLKARGLWLAGMDERAPQVVFDADLTGPLALVLGGEGRGLRRLTRERCDLLLRLPMCGAVESLNVSVAAGVCLYEALRQRLPAGSAAEAGTGPGREAPGAEHQANENGSSRIRQ
jgi:23S rRNA (guanosine2251-2'-O)-methyltransferase